MVRGPILAFLAFTTLHAATPPKLRLAEAQDVSPESYRVDLTLDPDKDEFSGTIHIAVKVNRPSQTFWLNANQITVQEASITAAGKTLAVETKPEGDDFLALQLTAPLPAGAAEIRIRYTGKVRTKDSSGIFQVTDSGNHYLLTQFENTEARDAFPCFDEPTYKVPWQLTLHVPAGQQAVSNTPPVSDTTAGGARTLVFARTKPLPSYLVAFGVGPFEFVDAGVAGSKRVPVHIVTPKGRAGEAKYAAEVTATILTRLEDYFGIPYPYEKSDQVAVPVTIGFGAMENPGMVTYGQTILLARPETDSIGRQRSYATIAAHELAHQWFGDLVTTAWWDDIWLNEAFATWMEQKLVAEWKPEWNTRVSDVDATLGAANADSLASARKIRQEIVTRDDIANAFDSITYEKGAAVIGMFENWMGPDAFRKGVQSFLRQYSFRTATSGDFLDSLSSAGRKDVTRPFSTFLNQAGVPIVSFALDCAAKSPTLHLEQSRYVPIGSKAPTAQTWSIPICVRWGEGKDDRACTLLSQRKIEWALPAKSCPAWIEASDNAKGYYRADYQGGLLASLAAGDVTKRLNSAERADLIGNAQALASGGKLPLAEALRLAETFRNDPTRQVAQRALDVALSVNRDLVPAELRGNYQRFLTKSWGARAHELGWLEKPGESEDVRLLRPAVVGAIASIGGDRKLAAQARELAEKWLRDRKSVPPDVVTAVLGAAAYYGDIGLYRRFLAEFQKTQDRQDQQKLVFAMTSFRDRAALEFGMEQVAAGKIRLVDGFPILLGGQRAPETRRVAFDFLTTHFDQIMSGNPSIFGFSLGALLPRAGSALCDPGSRKEFAEFFTPLAGKYDGAPRNLAQVLEGVDLCMARMNAQAPGVAAFLANY